jgi:transcriptional regulator with XRE-family HTH domain
MDNKVFGRFVALRRRELGLTQLQLASKLGITDKAVSKWERGLSYPDITLIPAVADALNISVAELMGSKPNEPNAVSETVRDGAVLPSTKHFAIGCGVAGLAALVLALLVQRVITPLGVSFFYVFVPSISILVSLILGFQGRLMREGFALGFLFGFIFVFLLHLFDAAFVGQSFREAFLMILIGVCTPALMCALVSMLGFSAKLLLGKMQKLAA